MPTIVEEGNPPETLHLTGRMQQCLHAFRAMFSTQTHAQPGAGLKVTSWSLLLSQQTAMPDWLERIQPRTKHHHLHFTETPACATPPIPNASSTRSNSSFGWGGDIFIHCCLLCYMICLEDSVCGACLPGEPPTSANCCSGCICHIIFYQLNMAITKQTPTLYK